MPIQLLDGNNVFVGLAQSLAADPKSANACYELDSVRRLMLNYINKHIQANRKVIIAADSWSWRKLAFEPYKFRRHADRKEGKDPFKYDLFINLMQQVFEELKAFSPVVVLRVDGAEGDDIMAAFATVFGADEGVDLHSGDHDMLQLQLLYQGIRQFNPRTWKWVTPDLEKYDLIDHIIRGDSGDGVPNILSDDDVFVTRTRQTVMTAGRYADVLAILKKENPEEHMDEEMKRRYIRNRTLIDLRFIPEELIIEIFAAYERELAARPAPGTYSKYMMSHGIL